MTLAVDGNERAAVALIVSADEQDGNDGHEGEQESQNYHSLPGRLPEVQRRRRREGRSRTGKGEQSSQRSVVQQDAQQ